MKKLFFLLSFVTLAFSSTVAGSISRTGLIMLQPFSQVSYRPNIRPFSDPQPAFTLFATEDQLILTSETVNSDVQLWIVSTDGIVFSTTETMTIGSEIMIDVEDLPEGDYTLYINNNGEILYAQFEIN